MKARPRNAVYNRRSLRQRNSRSGHVVVSYQSSKLGYFNLKWAYGCGFRVPKTPRLALICVRRILKPRRWNVGSFRPITTSPSVTAWSKHTWSLNSVPNRVCDGPKELFAIDDQNTRIKLKVVKHHTRRILSCEAIHITIACTERLRDDTISIHDAPLQKMFWDLNEIQMKRCGKVVRVTTAVKNRESRRLSFERIASDRTMDFNFPALV